MKFNHPIPGHTLLNEGHMHGVPVGDGGWKLGQVTAEGGCSCGYQPIDWPKGMAINKVKRWHREHKAAIRAGKPAPAVGLSFTTEGWGDLLHDVNPAAASKGAPKTALGWMQQPLD